MTTLLGFRDPSLSYNRFVKAFLARPKRSHGDYEVHERGVSADGGSCFLAVKRSYLDFVREHGPGLPALGGPVFMRHYPSADASELLRQVLPSWERFACSELNPWTTREKGAWAAANPWQIEEHYEIGPLDRALLVTSRYVFGVDLEVLARWHREQGRALPWSVGDALFRAGRQALEHLHGLGLTAWVTPRHLRVSLGDNCVLALCRPVLRLVAGQIVPEPSPDLGADLVSLASAIARLLPAPLGRSGRADEWSTDADYLSEVSRELGRTGTSSNALLQTLLTRSASAERGQRAASEPLPLPLSASEAELFWSAAVQASPDVRLLATA